MTLVKLKSRHLVRKLSLFFPVVFCSCFNQSDLKVSTSNNRVPGEPLPKENSGPEPASDNKLPGVTVSQVKGNSSIPQSIEVTDGSSIQGTQVVFPPGSIALDTNVQIQEAALVANPVVLAELGIDTSVVPTSRSVAIQPTGRVECVGNSSMERIFDA